MGYLICFIIGMLAGGAGLMVLFHKLTDGEIWSVFGGGQRDYDGGQPAQSVPAEDPSTMYDPFKQSTQQRDPLL